MIQRIENRGTFTVAVVNRQDGTVAVGLVFDGSDLHVDENHGHYQKDPHSPEGIEKHPQEIFLSVLSTGATLPTKTTRWITGQIATSWSSVEALCGGSNDGGGPA